MTTAQKVIKYLALAFAMFLIVSIFSGIMIGISTLSNIFKADDNITTELKDLNVQNTNITQLDIDINYANLTIKTGGTLKVETNNKNINYQEKGNKLIIEEKKYNWFNTKDESDLIVYIPSNYSFGDISIEAGTGKVNLENINTKKLELDLGAGKVTIVNLVVEQNAEIDGGAGEINIKNSSINNLDLSGGVGKFTLNSKLTGNNKIDAGVGQLYITLLGNKEDYKIVVDKGIGTAKINNESIKDGKIYGSGLNSLDVDGGIGNININFK